MGECVNYVSEQGCASNPPTELTEWNRNQHTFCNYAHVFLHKHTMHQQPPNASSVHPSPPPPLICMTRCPPRRKRTVQHKSTMMMMRRHHTTQGGTPVVGWCGTYYVGITAHTMQVHVHANSILHIMTRNKQINKQKTAFIHKCVTLFLGQTASIDTFPMHPPVTDCEFPVHHPHPAKCTTTTEVRSIGWPGIVTVILLLWLWLLLLGWLVHLLYIVSGGA